MLGAVQAGENVLLIAPTGGGKTLAGFLPCLVDLAGNPREGLHTLYVSPLKALAADVARNLDRPIDDMGLPVTVATRSGDTSSEARRRQREAPPNLLLTTPESLAGLISQPESALFFQDLRSIIVDEVHAVAGTKRGAHLAPSGGTCSPSAPPASLPLRLRQCASASPPPSPIARQSPPSSLPAASSR